MDPEAFKFITVRPPQEVAGATFSSWAWTRAQAASSQPFQRIANHCSARHCSRLSPQSFAPMSSSTDRPRSDETLWAYYSVWLNLPIAGFSQAAFQAFERSFETELNSFLNRAAFSSVLQRVGDRIVADT